MLFWGSHHFLQISLLDCESSSELRVPNLDECDGIMEIALLYCGV